MNINEIKISQLLINDLNSISDNISSEFYDFWKLKTLQNELTSPNRYYICAKYNNDIVGFCGINICFDYIDLMNIVVNKNCRNLGIGSILLNNIITYSKSQQNINSILLEVNENNLTAIKLYTNFGFKIISIRKNYYKTDSAIIMKLTY